MTRIIESFSEVSDRYDALFCDLWGCVHDGLSPFLEAVAAMRAFRARGGTVMLRTHRVQKHLLKHNLMASACPVICTKK